MSILSLLKRQRKEKDKEFILRRNAFFKEYNELARKHNCDWQPFIQTDEHGQRAQPRLTIIDATEVYKKEEEEKLEKEAVEKTNEEGINKP